MPVPHKIEWNGEILTIRDICKKEGISEGAVYHRMKKTGENIITVLMYYLNKPNKGNKGVREKVKLNGGSLSIKKYCKQLNYDYNLVIRYKVSQPDKTYTEILEKWEDLSQDEILNNIHLYDIWTGMLGRCENPKYPSYRWYGGKKPKPVTVCKEWHDYMTFRNQVWNDYIKHVEQYGREQTTIDRKKTWYNYSYKECQWADWEQQHKNTSRVKYILSTGETLRHYCKQMGYKYTTIVKYIRQYNLTPDKALAKYLK